MSAPRQIRLVTLDAGGTLIEPVEPVGATYARLARAAGFDVRAADMEAGFRRAFRAAPPLVAPRGTPEERLAFERAWWRAIVDASLDASLGRTPGAAHDQPTAAERSARDRFFEAAFRHYARGAAWRTFPEVPQVLAELRRLGLTLAVVSNFDARLHRVLTELGIREPFAAVVVSSEAGAAKPDPAIFAHALAAAGGHPPEACLHVGDSLEEDVAGARRAGLAAALVVRRASPDRPSGAAPGSDDVPRLSSLAGIVELAGRLQSST